MSRSSVWCVVTVFVAVAVTGCGDDSGNEDGNSAGTAAGSQSQGASGASGTANNPAPAAGTLGNFFPDGGVSEVVVNVTCGEGTCPGVDTAFLGFSLPAPCCANEATSACGYMDATSGECTPLPESDPECPDPGLGFPIATCCGANGICGLNLAQFGLGCFSVSLPGAGMPCGPGAADEDAGTAPPDAGSGSDPDADGGI